MRFQRLEALTSPPPFLEEWLSSLYRAYCEQWERLLEEYLPTVAAQYKMSENDFMLGCRLHVIRPKVMLQVEELATGEFRLTILHQGQITAQHKLALPNVEP